MRDTPYLVVDVDVLEANLAAMAAHARALGVALRPHAKTHKSIDIARRQLAHGAVGLTVATVAEAEIFAAATKASGIVACSCVIVPSFSLIARFVPVRASNTAL